MSKEDYKNNFEIDDTLYGINNEVYTIENIENEQIVVKCYKKIYITFNSGNNQEVKIKEEILYFSFNDIGIKLFFKEDDCFKPLNELFKDNDYLEFVDNLNNRKKTEEDVRRKELEYIESLKPNAKQIETNDINTILSSYTDENKSMSEEIDFYNYSKNNNLNYFARMDLNTIYQNDNYYEKFYIGKNIQAKEIKEGLTIIDWRSPLGDFYYNSEVNELIRDIYTYKVLLKRKFSFLPFKYLNTYIANSKFFNEGMADEFLMQILTEKRNSNKLTDIIYSIQSNQNKIIRTKSNENFIVQGCAGSGKTMILLHRLTYLKYNKLLPAYDKIKIITPSKVFNDFISDLSRDLDISEIEQVSMTNYYLSLNDKYSDRNSIVSTLNDKYRYRFNNNETGFNIEQRNKKLKQILDSIRETVRRKKNRYKDAFNVDRLIDENRLNPEITDLFYKKDFIYKVKEEYSRRIDDIKEEISKIIILPDTSNSNQYFEIAILKIIELIDGLVARKEEFSFNKYKNDEIDLKIEKLEQLLDKILNDYYFSYDFYNLIIENIQINNPILPRGKLMKYQLLLMLYINYLHFGEILNGDSLLCIDEAQDYNENEYKILKLINRNIIFNLYGDINQSIYSRGIKDWNLLNKIIEFNQYNLNENYRNTEQITNFCNEKFNYNINSMGITGQDVKYIEKRTINNIILSKINEKKRIAIITKKSEMLENIIPIDSEYTFYNTISEVKGIEYDSVIVFDDDMTDNEKYIAYTRALNELYIVDNN